MTVERAVKQHTPTAATSDLAREDCVIETPDNASIADLTPADVHAWLAALAAGEHASNDTVRTVRPAPAAPAKPIAPRRKG